MSKSIRRANRSPAKKVHHRRKWIKTKAAHAVDDARRQGLDADPHVREPSSDLAVCGDAPIINGAAKDQRAGTLPAGGEQIRQCREVMLTVGINLDRMAESFGRGKLERFDHRAALALNSKRGAAP